MVTKNTNQDIRMYYGATVAIQDDENQPGNTQSDAEKILWDEIKNKKLMGYQFKKQYPLKDFIVDFYCREAKLVVEIDKGINNKNHNLEYEMNKICDLQKNGIICLQFTNDEIFYNLKNVIKQIKVALN